MPTFRRPAMAVAVLSAALGSAGPSSAAPRDIPSRIVIHSNGGGVVDLNLPHGGSIDDRWTFTGAGRYRVALLDKRLAHRSPSSATSVLRYEVAGVTGQLGRVFSSHKLALDSGLYRLTVVSDRPVSLSFVISGFGASRTLQARPVQVQKLLHSGAPQLPLASSSNLALHRDHTTLILDVGIWAVTRFPGADYFQTRSCLRREASGPCAGDTGEGSGVGSLVLNSETTVGIATYYDPTWGASTGLAETHAAIKVAGQVLDKESHLTIGFPV